MKPQYTISELAEEFKITTRTIRFYEDKGLLSPEREGQRRIYHSADKTRLKLILRGKRIGLSLNESQEIIDLYDHKTNNITQMQKLLAAINKQRVVLEKKKLALQAMENELDDVETRCQQALTSKQAD